MSGAADRLPTEALIARLARDAGPVRRLWRPWARSMVWFAAVAILGGLVATQADLPAAAARVLAFPDMWLAVVGSVLTAALAGVAAVMLSLPDRSGRWAWLPWPGVALWLGASGLGCLRYDVIATLHPASMQDAMRDCLPFILKLSVVLAVPLGILLWRARPLRPGLVCSMGGLAVAAAAASLLWLVHPFDASAIDLLVHAGAVLTVVLACRLAAAIPGRRAPP